MFKDKNVVLTGAAEGVGRSIALAFARAGANLILADHQHQGGTVDGIEAAVGRKPPCILCDIQNEQQVIAMGSQVREISGGKVHVLVNNAGFNGMAQLVENMPLEAWNKTIGTNLTGTMLVVRELIPLLRAARGAAIVNVASNVAKRGIPYRADYCCSKWAMLGLTQTQTLALELARDDIRVNAVCPGPIEGERVEQLLEMHSRIEQRPLEEMRRDWMNVPMGRFIHPGEVAGAILFLAGKGSSAMTGQALNVTGGFIMN